MEKKPIRIALSGSGFRLGAHLGALQAIEDAGYEIVQIAGTSGGSIIAALYAGGMPLKDMRDLCMKMDWSPMMRFSLWAVLTKHALCSGNHLLKFLLEKTQNQKFSDLKMDLRIIASDLLTEKEFLFSKESTPDAEIALAARASASIPVVFSPVCYKDSLCVDGGCTDNLPASDLTVDSIPRMGIYLESDDSPLLPGCYNIKTLAPRLIDLLLASNELSHIALDSKNGAVIVKVQTGYASSFDRNMDVKMRQRLYRDGYISTTKALMSL